MSIFGATALVVAAMLLQGCDTNAFGGEDQKGFEISADKCSIPVNEILDGGVRKDGIPALTDPDFADVGLIDFVDDNDRVVGFVIDGESLAIPHNVFWYHEIVNLNMGSTQVAITYCPLTGSAIGFDRSVIDGAEFGVSGLLYNSNLTMYNRQTDETLWPQMLRKGGCGTEVDTRLVTYPVTEMKWSLWKELHPNSKVYLPPTGAIRSDYTFFPYGNYEDLTNNNTLFPIPGLSNIRPLKERVVGIPDGNGGGIAVPFGELGTSNTAVQVEVNGQTISVLWDAEGESGHAFASTLGGVDVSFSAVDGGFQDSDGGTIWSVEGLGLSGPRAGERLSLVPDSYVAFWFAWKLFQPETNVYLK